jgi:transposase
MLEKVERVSTANTGLARRTRSKAQKRQIVEETQREGASVRSVARAHDIPANQLFHWRKLYREGLLGSDAEAATESELMAVRVVGEPQRSAEPEMRNQADRLVVASSSGTIQIEAEKGRLILQGAVDPATLRVILERLLG